MALPLAVAALVWSTGNPRKTDLSRNQSIEMVMHDNVSIEVVGADGPLRVSSKTGLDRSYNWGNCLLWADMRPRSTRWFGSLGAYDPAGSFGLFSWGCDGFSRTVVQEGQIHFDTEAFANEWIRRRPASYENTWSKNGVLVSWAFRPGRSQLGVAVWLMCLNGQPFAPASRPNIPELKITPNSRGQSIRDCKAVERSEIRQTRAQIEEFWARIDSR